jgi:hypothetical protein
MWHPFLSRSQTNPRRDRKRRAHRTCLERLEERTLLSYTDFELSSLLPANGGDGSNGFVVDGIVDRGRLGYPMRGYHPLGDVNQDGVDDYFLAAPGVTTSAPGTIGQVYLIFGRSGGLPAEFDLQTLNGTNGYRLDGVQLGEGTGIFGSGAGDVNYDGFPDLAIGATNADPSVDRVDAGQTYVVYGGLAHLAALDLADGTTDGRITLAALDGAHGFTINGALAGRHTGVVSAAGDVNGDHADDLVITTNFSYPGPGMVYVVFGRDSTLRNTFPATFELSSLNGSNGFVVPGPFGPNSSSVGSVGGGGDVNGDGIGDLVIGALYVNLPNKENAGQAYVIFGRTSFPASFAISSLNGNNGFTVNGSADHDYMGWEAAQVAGDINGDGVDDVLIGARGLDTAGGVVGLNGSNAGGAVVVFGKSTTFPATLEISALNGSNGFVVRGVSPNDYLAEASAAGDVNGDGYDDLILSATSADPHGITDAGQSYLVYGRPSFGADLNLASLLASNGGDGSAGYALNGFLPSGGSGFIAAIGDINNDGLADVRIGALNADSDGLTDNGQAYIVYGKPSPPPVTKFYVVNDASGDRTYEYSATGTTVEDYALSTGNTAPRGAATSAAGDKAWVVDTNKKVYVYNTNGGLLGSWTAGTLASNATVEGIATNGTDIWLVDAQQDKVFRYTGAASRLSGSQNAASSFALNSSNTSPKDVVTDGTSLWVVNDSSTDKVFKYNLAGTLQGSWTITGAGTSPTGITLDPTGGGQLWVADSGTDRAYQFDNARTRTSGSQSPSTSFALAAGNTNPQGIADPPVPASGASHVATLNNTAHPSGNLAALHGRTIPSLKASKPSGSFFPRTAVRSSVVRRQELPILISLMPSTDQDITLLAADLLRTGTKRSITFVTRTKV